MAPTTFTGTLLEKIPWSPDTVTYRFSRPPEYRFEAGQFFRLTIPSPSGPLTHYFSHCDSPAEGRVELTTRLTGSDYKKALDALPLGAEVQFEGPMGRFLFKYEAPKIAFLTGGIGITPIRSILRHLVDTGGEGRTEGQELVLFYGSMTEEGIPYKNELDEFARTISGLRVLHVITKPSESWQGYTGFITADIVRAELGDPREWTYYIVGPPPMITAMEKVMEQLGIPESQRLIEGFAGYES